VGADPGAVAALRRERHRARVGAGGALGVPLLVWAARALPDVEKAAGRRPHEGSVPVMLKSTARLVVAHPACKSCRSIAQKFRDRFGSFRSAGTEEFRARGRRVFGAPSVERARQIEVALFGDGKGGAWVSRSVSAIALRRRRTRRSSRRDGPAAADWRPEVNGARAARLAPCTIRLVGKLFHRRVPSSRVRRMKPRGVLLPGR